MISQYFFDLGADCGWMATRRARIGFVVCPVLARIFALVGL